MKNIVCIGGGTGTYQVITGLKKHEVNLSAVISMSDSGGSTGRLSRELGILPPGDVRRAILAMSNLPFAQRTLEEVFEFRFNNGNSLSGHSLGNILLAALTQITGSMDRAIVEAARILNATGEVFPVTLNKTNLVAVLEDGTRVYGETNIDRRDFKLKYAIKNIYLNPKANVFRNAADSIKKADLIVLGPGDLYTSIIPVLLVKGVNEAIAQSKGKLAYVVNLMTERGETDNFGASDHVEEVQKYLEIASKKLSHVIVSKTPKSSKSRTHLWYKRYGSIPVKDNLRENGQFEIVRRDFVDQTTLFRHSPEKLSKTLISLL